MNTSMFISIIIPVYNGEEYLSDCLDSCLEQDISSDDYEIICIDDGSIDSTSEILDNYARRYDRIKVFVQDNKGVSASRNVGLDHAQGDYIMFVDSDDLLSRNVLGLLKSNVERSCCDRIVTSYCTGDSDDAQKFLDASIDSSASIHGGLDTVRGQLFSNKVIKTHRLRFFERITHGEDGLFVNDYENASSTSCNYSDITYFYRIHSGSAVDRSDLDNLKKILSSYINIVIICKNRVGDKSYDKQINYDFWNNHMRFFLRFVPELPYKERLIYLRKVKKAEPYLYIRNKQPDKTDIPKELFKRMKRMSRFRRFETIIYANAFGAHLIRFRQLILSGKISYVLTHPQRVPRVIKNLKKSHRG